MSKRFDYIKYDSFAMQTQARVRELCESLEIVISNLGQGRSQSEALTNLENFYAWAGKAIRDNQVARTGESKDVPERGQIASVHKIISTPTEDGPIVRLPISGRCMYALALEGGEIYSAETSGSSITIPLFKPFYPPPLPNGHKWNKLSNMDGTLEGYYSILGGII